MSLSFPYHALYRQNNAGANATRLLIVYTQTKDKDSPCHADAIDNVIAVPISWTLYRQNAGAHATRLLIVYTHA